MCFVFFRDFNVDLVRNAIVSANAHLSGHSHENNHTTLVDLSAVRFYTGTLRLSCFEIANHMNAFPLCFCHRGIAGGGKGVVSGSVSPAHIHLVIHSTDSEAFDIDSEKNV